MENANHKRFMEAVQVISPRIRTALSALPVRVQEEVQEIRLRADKPVIAVTKSGSAFVSQSGRLTLLPNDNILRIAEGELRDTVSRVCGYSLHSFQKDMVQGFVTVPGGHRVGLCGTAVTENGKITALKDVSCLNLRIAREVFGAADEILQGCFKGKLRNVLLAGPPSSGKTTVLRDLIRQISGGCLGFYCKTAVVDERSELSAVSGLHAGNDLGMNTDILNGYPKAQGLSLCIRSLSPEIVFCDEIGGTDEVQAVRDGLFSGVHFVLTAHAANMQDLKSREQTRALLETGMFDCAVFLRNSKAPGAIGEIVSLGETEDESGGTDLDTAYKYRDGTVFFDAPATAGKRA